MIVTIFRSRLRPDGEADYFALAPRIAELARGMAGYISHKVFTAEDGERVTVVEFDSLESQRAWATQMDHVAAKQQGRASFYAAYSIQVCEVLRSSRFDASTPAEG